MTKSEITKYIAAHEKFINGALKIMRGRVPFEELEDARQELYITMIKCLNNYDPEKGPLDVYVNVSVGRRGQGLFDEYIAKTSPNIGTKENPKIINIISLHDVRHSDNGEEYLSESIEDDRGLLDVLDAKLINDDLMKGLSPDMRTMVKMWSEGAILKEIALVVGQNYETVRGKIRAALEEMRTLVDDEKRSRRLL